MLSIHPPSPMRVALFCNFLFPCMLIFFIFGISMHFSVIFANLTVTQLVSGLEGEKDIFFVWFAVLGSGITTLTTLAEPLLCDSFLVGYGGHILFDFSIPIATYLYFIVAKGCPPRRKQGGKSNGRSSMVAGDLRTGNADTKKEL
jgi:hypothetical protein